MFTCEICKIFKNTYFAEHLRTPASKVSKKRYPLSTGVILAETKRIEPRVFAKTDLNYSSLQKSSFLSLSQKTYHGRIPVVTEFTL